jgi:di/tricarboxylate transporter
VANTLIIVGAGLVVLGILAKFGLMSWFGNLPGDIRIQNERTTIFAPITSMLVISVLGSVLVNLASRWFGE